MSRRITVETELTDEEILKESLEELDADFTVENGELKVSSVDGQNLYYNGAGVDLETGEAYYDEDCPKSRELFKEGKLKQLYNKNLYLDRAYMEGHQVDEVFTADEETHVEGFDESVEDGDIVIKARANFN